MRIWIYLTLSILLLVQPLRLSAQDDTTPQSASGDDERTLKYDESFTTGDSKPLPPPEGEPQTEATQNPDRTPDSNPANDPRLDQEPENFRFGVTGALTVPHIINIGLETIIFQKYGISLNRGNISQPVNSVNMRMEHNDIRFRWHPWGGSFFGAIAIGQQTMVGEQSKDITATLNGEKKIIPTTVKMTAKANYIAPHIGWFAIWDPGFTVGLDIGWLFPQKPTTNSSVSYQGLPAGTEDTLNNTAEYRAFKSDVDDSVQARARKGLPFLTMMRVGWMF